MSHFSYYHCQHCREEVCVEISCPCCGLGHPERPPTEEFLDWLKVHVLGIKMRYEAMAWDIDHGYLKACKVLETELRRLIEEHKDGSDRITGDQGLLDG